jgi:REP element-mobilizing transposase RayT
MLRGNNRQNIFYSDEDRSYFAFLIQKGVQSYGHRIHAFCLMGNHVHLAIEVNNIGLSKIIHNLSSRYTKWINKKQKTIGHLFQGRYKAILVEQDPYFLMLIRYIHLNPVRAKITTSPERYRWSSHRSYLGLEKISWLTTNWALSLFSVQIDIARSSYESFVLEEMNKGDQNTDPFSLNKIEPLSNEDFFNDSIKYIDENFITVSIDDLLTIVCRVFELQTTDLVGKIKDQRTARAKAIVAFFVNNIDNLSFKVLGNIFNCKSPSLSYHAKNIEKLYYSDQKIHAQIDEIKRLLHEQTNKIES